MQRRAEVVQSIGAGKSESPLSFYFILVGGLDLFYFWIQLGIVISTDEFAFFKRVFSTTNKH